MGKKESTTSSPKGMCEKIFNAFNPGSRPHRPPAFHHQEPRATTDPSPTQPNHPLNSGMKEPSPQKALPTPVKPGTSTPKAEPKQTTPPSLPASVLVQNVPGKVEPTPARPKAGTTPQPAPPKAAATAADESSKKNINQRVEEYIKRAKEKMRAVSGVGRAPTSKWSA